MGDTINKGAAGKHRASDLITVPAVQLLQLEIQQRQGRFAALVGHLPHITDHASDNTASNQTAVLHNTRLSITTYNRHTTRHMSHRVQSHSRRNIYATLVTQDTNNRTYVHMITNEINRNEA